MKHTLIVLAAAAGTVCAQQSAYGQCGGKEFQGSTSCVTGYTCSKVNDYYSQCIPQPSDTTAAAAYGQCGGQQFHGCTSCVPGYTCSKQNDYYSQCIPVPAQSSNNSAPQPTTTAAVAAYGQCGGQQYHGCTTCISGYTCSKQNDYYSQCIPNTGNSSGPPPYSSSSPPAYTTPTPSPTPSPTPTPSSTPSTSSGHVQYAGLNIAGFDFGCATDGTCSLAAVYPPGMTGINQMKHFITEDGLNAFRLPVAWQYLVNNNLGGTLDSTNFANYDSLVQGCLGAGAAFCIIDIHNYARWDGGIIGQGGPSNAQFASLWSQLASKYKNSPNVVFGIMNEPHDVDITKWAESVQAAVTAIRQAGATSNKCLLPGNDWTSASTYIDNGSAAALSKVTNLDGSTTNLFFDFHKYLDSDGSGTHITCVTNNVDVFTKLGDYLRTIKRQGFLSETGGGESDSSCITNVCEELDKINSYSDVFLGWTAWSAGMFAPDAMLSASPSLVGNTYVDVPLVKQCIAAKFKQY